MFPHLRFSPLHLINTLRRSHCASWSHRSRRKKILLTDPLVTQSHYHSDKSHFVQQVSETYGDKSDRRRTTCRSHGSSTSRRGWRWSSSREHGHSVIVLSTNWGHVHRVQILSLLQSPRYRMSAWRWSEYSTGNHLGNKRVCTVVLGKVSDM